MSSVNSLAAERERCGEAAERVGTIVDGKYDVCQLIAVGGVGAVYRARHRFTGREVALKLLREKFSSDRAMAERFLREAKAAADIGHPCIIDVVDAGVDDKVGVFVAFEFLDGFDFAAAIKDHSLSIDEVLDVADNVLDALAAAHEAGVIHRDIKPSNIFVVPDEEAARRVRVLDFGAAKRLQLPPEDSLTVVGTVIGTPAYMSPEQAAGTTVTPQSDLWSVGAVLFRAFADRTPFTAPSSNLLLACIIRDSAPSLAEFRPDLHPTLIELVDKALERDLSRRWQSAPMMREALREARRCAALPRAPVRFPAVVPERSKNSAPFEETTVPELPGVDAALDAGTSPSKFGAHYRLVMAVTALVLLPLFAFYILFARQGSSFPSAADSETNAGTVAVEADVVNAIPVAVAVASAPAPTSSTSGSAVGPSAAGISTAEPAAPRNARNVIAPARKRVRDTDSADTGRPRVAPIREYE